VPEVEHAARNCIAAHCDVLPGRHPEVGPLKSLIGERRLNCEFDGLNEKIKIKKRKTLFFNREDTRSWLEVRPTFSIAEEYESDGGGVFGFRYAMVIAFILFDPDVRIGDTSDGTAESSV